MVQLIYDLLYLYVDINEKNQFFAASDVCVEKQPSEDHCNERTHDRRSALVDVMNESNGTVRQLDGNAELPDGLNDRFEQTAHQVEYDDQEHAPSRHEDATEYHVGVEDEEDDRDDHADETFSVFSESRHDGIFV